MSIKTNLIALVVLAVLAGGVIVLRPQTSTVSKDLTPGFQSFLAADLNSVERLTLAKGGKEPATVEVRKKGEGWTLPGTWDYPADKKKVQEVLDELKKVREGERRGSRRESHAQFKVDKEKGVSLVLQGKDDRKLAELVIGGDAQSRTLSSGNFIRFGDEDQVWAVNASLRNKVISYPDKVEPKTFLEKILWKLPEDQEAVRVVIVRPDHNVIVEKRVVEVPVPQKPEDPRPEGEVAKEPETKEPETKKEDEFWVTSGTSSFKVDKSKEWDAKNLLAREVRVEDAAKKLDPKDYKEFGLDQPHLKVEITHRKKDQNQAAEEKVTIAFGNAIREEKKEEGDTKDGDKKEEKKEEPETKSYYAMLEGPVGEGRIYTVGKWDYNYFNKELKDFEKPPEPKKEEPKKDETKAEEAAAPAGEAPPAVPPAEGSSTSGQPVPATSPDQPAPAQPGTPPPAAPATPPPAPPPSPPPPASK